MTLKILSLPFALAGLLILNGCGSDDGGDVLAPTNLQVSYNLAGVNQNILNVTATANNAKFYRFDFGDGSDIVENTSGLVTYSYQQEGDYELTVTAHASETIFVSATEPISVALRDPTEFGYDAPTSYDGYTLVWSDEFNGTELGPDWTYEIGDGCPNLCGWGNNELEYYRAENTSVSDGYLKITAKKESFGGRQYTSSRLITKDKQEFQYGRIDIRAIMPKGQGMWPALWMLGENIDDVSWPACGEIDIMEMIGGDGNDNTVHGTVHWDNNGQYANYGGSKTKSSGILADNWHVYSIIWNEQEIIWLLDNVQYHVIDISPVGLSEFDNEFFFIFNVAVGGNWPGSPSGQTVFPQSMLVDYVRVYQQP